MRKRLGFTLVELMLYITIASVIMLAIGSFLYLVSDYFNLNSGEFIIQSNVRHAMQKISDEVRKATVSFIITSDDYTGRVDDLTPEWNYIGLNEDATDIVQYIYDKSQRKHICVSITQNKYDTKYKMTLSKVSGENKRLLNVDLQGQLQDLASIGSNTYKLTSQVEATNTKNMFSRETDTKPGVAIAYRTDGIPKGIKIRVGLVLDNSGSMTRDVAGAPSSYSGNDSRLSILNEKTKKLLNDLSQMGVVDAALVFFSTYKNSQTPLYDLNTHLSEINNKLDSMVATGVTNMGDGFRFALDTVNSASYDPEIEYKNYYILLTDGHLNTYTTTGGEDNYALGAETSVQYILTYPGKNPELMDRPYLYIGQLYQKYLSLNNGIKKVYVIGFSGKPGDIDEANIIARECGGNYNGVNYDNYYEATNSDDLEKVFEEISNDIAKEVWYVMGP